MHTTETTPHRKEVTVFGGNPTQPTSGSNAKHSAHLRNEPLGRLHGTTLTEQVMGFLERYNRPVYSLG
jgi:hypothetical protein